MKLIKSLAATAVLVFGVQSASALLVTDNSRFGANTLIQDTNTGLSWLRLDQTVGRSFSDVASQLGSGGTYEGFRVATYAEASSLLFGNVAPLDGNLFWLGAQPQPLRNFLNAVQFTTLFGAPVRYGPGLTFSSVVAGWYGSGEDYSDGRCSLGPCFVQSAGVSWSLGRNGYAAGGFLDGVGTGGQSFTGTYLIAAPIPEPSTYALMLAGLLAVGWAARRRSG
jgi:hypothetical protein